MSLSSVKQSRNTLVPILLNEFPIPPTFIPTTSNPPPSRPPSLPLPPIPGPSPLTNQDLFHITAAARSRRASRISTSSNSSWRDSVASLGSGSSHGGRNRTESVTSISAHSTRSFSSNGALSIPRAINSDHPRPSPISMALNPAILEDDELVSNSTAEPSLTRTSLSDIPHATSSLLPPDNGESTLRDERISSIDMHDLPALQDDDTVDPDSQAHTVHAQIRSARSKVPTHKVNTRQAMPQPRRNTSPTGGKNHRRTASATQHSRDRESSHGAGHPPTAFPSMPLPDGSDRASSPDILTFIAATPRSRRRSETSSTRSRSRSQSRPRAPKSLPGSCRTSAVGRASVFSLPDEPRRQSEGSATLASRSQLPYVNKGDEGNSVWNDDSFLEDYGVVINRGDGEFAVPDEEDTAGDSDSSLDLHTPLPSLMLRDGMLSPYSKLLPQNIRVDSPVVATHNIRPGSISNRKRCLSTAG
ncbi:hypothetical protein BGW80DRAFT_177719 [Lactifluus volemus]|nr:hypothetical protein BGW80DRAFT_177719 [Lactifluus volemus]